MKCYFCHKLDVCRGCSVGFIVPDDDTVTCPGCLCVLQAMEGRDRSFVKYSAAGIRLITEEKKAINKAKPVHASQPVIRALEDPEGTLLVSFS